MKRKNNFLLVLGILLVISGVYLSIKNHSTVSVDPSYAEKLMACDSIPNGTTREVKQYSRMFIKLPRDIYPETNISSLFKTINGNSSAVDVSNAEQSGEALDANAECSSTYVEFIGIGVVEFNVPSNIKEMPDYSVRFLVTAFSQ